MKAIIALIIFSLTFVLLPNTVLAADDYNSCRSNTSVSIYIAEQTGLDEAVVAEILKEFTPSEFTTLAGDTIATIIIEEGKLREKLISLGVDEERTQGVLDGLRRGATQEFLAALPNPGLTPASPFYFLERWGEAIRELFTFSAEAKIKWHTEQALERIAEVKAILDKENLTIGHVDHGKAALKRLEKNVQKASTLFKSDGTPGRSVSGLALQLGAGLENRRMALNAIFEEADERRVKQGEGNPWLGDIAAEINKAFAEADGTLKAVQQVREAARRTDPDSATEPAISAPTQKETPSAAVPAGEGARAATDYNSSISNSHTVGKIREEIGNVLIRYGAGGAEINRVTGVLEVGVDKAELIALLREINISEAGIQEVLVELERLGTKQR